MLHIFIRSLFFASLLLPLMGYAKAELPSFDFEKAKQLSAEKRREYDVVFFNEVAIWNMNSNRYGPNQANSSAERVAEFKRMAADGYLPAYAALRLLDIERGIERKDPEALNMLVKAADAGDASAMCAFMAIPFNRALLPYEEIVSISTRLLKQGVKQNHPACLARKGAGYLLGVPDRVPQNTKTAMPLLLESARQGYYVPAWILFYWRSHKALDHHFDFTDLSEFKRALCWGRLAEQHTNHAGFDNFLGLLGEYARINNRQDLVEMSYPYDPRRISITQTVVKPEDCIRLEETADGHTVPTL